ncbi:class I adenylate-forming enzyme family protein [Streptomyces sp. Rer75]|uniref:class I adenylate-forming enzyme family protein n=1 Tax=Streptomyces sp. Rer75 TaxID=2750011 RepID=UPI0015D02BD9|nr:class I adenylate-forming enzyme family protein [Streptomyces sp. Rer75]QLH19399.1 acyl--CoA ligase [Streptomyces sp. Rer75]
MAAKIFAADSVETLKEFEQKALAMADTLRARGVHAGSRVLLKAGNSTGFVGGLLALMHVGASIVLVDQQEKADETERIRTQARAKIVLCDDDAPVLDGAELMALYEVMAASADRTPVDRALDFTTWSALPDGLIMWSSGSTGPPKGIVKNGGRFLKNLERNAHQVGHHSGDVLLPLLPFNHQYGLSMVLIAWITRCSLVIAPYRRPDRALRIADYTRATVLDATPATYRSILNILRTRPAMKAGLGTVRMFCSGAAPLDPTLSRSYVDEFGLPLLDSYGSTELGNVSFATSDNPVACGRVMEGLALKVVGDGGDPLPAGEIGELLVDCPDMMLGHLDAEGDLTPAPQGWFSTGDLGYLDDAGHLHVIGRKSAVNRNGYTLYPEIIERKIADHGCSAKIVSLPAADRGCSLVFFVEDELARDAKHWQTLINDVLPPWERPNRVHVIDRFPLNANGKPHARKLEELARELFTHGAG